MLECCCILIVEDSNSKSEVVAIWVVAQENSTIINQLLDLFQTQNASCGDTVTVITDKDFVE